MRTSGGKAAPPSRWAEVLFRVCAVAIPLVAVPLGSAVAATTASVLEPRTLLTLGIILGVIAFAVWAAIACLRARERARKAEAEAELEAERYRLSQNTLETLLAAEPQALVTLAETGEADLLVATLPPALGVPRDVPGLLDFAGWLDSDSAQALHEAIDTLAARGDAFNLMLHTQPDRFVEADGWTAGRTVLIKIRDLAGQRLDLADLAAKHQELEEQVSSLRGLLEDAQRSEPVRVEVKPSLEARFRSFDRLATAFALFDGTQRLTHFNQA